MTAPAEAIAAAKLPAAPGPGARTWRCKCGNVLGVVDGRWLWSRHRGREVLGSLPAAIRCEACGKKNARS